MATFTAFGATPSSEALKNITVVIQNHKFNPAEITIQKGESITWVNEDSVGHNASGKNFNTGFLGSEQSKKLIFNEVGTFDYHCTQHRDMKGTIIVK